MVVEWGYCSLRLGDKALPVDEIVRLGKDAEAGDRRSLLDRANELGLFVPNFTDCKDFANFYPL